MYQITKRITDRTVAVVLSGPTGHFEAAAVVRKTHYQVTAWPGGMMTTAPRLATRGTMNDAAAELEHGLWEKALERIEPARRAHLFDGWA